MSDSVIGRCNAELKRIEKKVKIMIIVTISIDIIILLSIHVPYITILVGLINLLVQLQYLRRSVKKSKLIYVFMEAHENGYFDKE